MENLKVLVLNADFLPLNLIPLSAVGWQEAFTIITKGNAVPIKYHEDKFVNTPSAKYPVPSVIVLKEYKHFKKHAKWSKFNIKLRDEFTCQYCNRRFSHRSLTIDHVIPKAKGGKHSWTNSVTACKPCNQRKKDRTDMKPSRKPVRPTYYDLARKLLKTKKVEHSDWGPYVEFLS